MFVLKKEFSYSWPVTVRMPKDGGSYEEEEFSCTFRIQAQDELEALVAAANEGGDDTAFQNGADVTLLRKVVVGWDGVTGEDGEPLAFSPDALSELTANPFIRLAMMRSYFKSVMGQEARRKN